jgi:hypothetical protein
MAMSPIIRVKVKFIDFLGSSSLGVAKLFFKLFGLFLLFFVLIPHSGLES